MISSLKLADFTCFGDNKFDFCNGINVFIGANATGKTHLLKILSVALKYRSGLMNGQSANRDQYEKEGISVEVAETLSDINSNLILDEFAEYHDAEQRYFNQTLAG